MDRIQQDLQSTTALVQTVKTLRTQRDQLLEQLTQDLLYLDGTPPSPERREMVYSIQHAIDRLEQLF